MQGFGLLDSVIIDQHFIVRSRYNRMVCIGCIPHVYNVGIDESTAIVVHHKEVKIVGESQVIVMREPEHFAN